MACQEWDVNTRSHRRVEQCDSHRRTAAFISPLDHLYIHTLPGLIFLHRVEGIIDTEIGYSQGTSSL